MRTSVAWTGSPGRAGRVPLAALMRPAARPTELAPSWLVLAWLVVWWPHGTSHLVGYDEARQRAVDGCEGTLDAVLVAGAAEELERVPAPVQLRSGVVGRGGAGGRKRGRAERVSARVGRG